MRSGLTLDVLFLFKQCRIDLRASFLPFINDSSVHSMPRMETGRIEADKHAHGSVQGTHEIMTG